jgi:hypothetical protein
MAERPSVDIFVRGVDADAFDAAVVELLYGDRPTFDSRRGDDMVVRKKPGRTTYHTLHIPDPNLPTPDRAVNVAVTLFNGEEVVASGRDTVSPPRETVYEEPCDACIEK